MDDSTNFIWPMLWQLKLPACKIVLLFYRMQRNCKTEKVNCYYVFFVILDLDSSQQSLWSISAPSNIKAEIVLQHINEFHRYTVTLFFQSYLPDLNGAGQPKIFDFNGVGNFFENLTLKSTFLVKIAKNREFHPKSYL